MFHKLAIFFICFLLTVADALAYEVLSPNQFIDSEHLGYKLQYRVYVPGEIQPGIKVPTLYLTVDQWYGRIVEVLEREITRGTIESIVSVFVDSRDPDEMPDNRRKDEFLGKDSYIALYKNELVPLISMKFPVSPDRTKRVIEGISFGGLNAVGFGLLASDTFLWHCDAIACK